MPAKHAFDLSIRRGLDSFFVLALDLFFRNFDFRDNRAISLVLLYELEYGTLQSGFNGFGFRRLTTLKNDQLLQFSCMSTELVSKAATDLGQPLIVERIGGGI